MYMMGEGFEKSHKRVNKHYKEMLKWQLTDISDTIKLWEEYLPCKVEAALKEVKERKKPSENTLCC